MSLTTCIPRTFARVMVLAAALGVAAQANAAQTEAKAEAPKVNPEHKFELAAGYYAECQNVDSADFLTIRPRLRAFTDAEVMAQMMADPLEAARLMEVVMDPRTLHVMMRCATEPVMWDTWMKGATDYEKMFRAMTPFMNPATYMRWAMAPFNPEFQATMARMSSPQATANWMTAMANPTFYQPFFMFMDPNFYTPRLAWMMNPASYQPMFDLMTLPVPTTEVQE